MRIEYMKLVKEVRDTVLQDSKNYSINDLALMYGVEDDGHDDIEQIIDRCVSAELQRAFH